MSDLINQALFLHRKGVSFLQGQLPAQWGYSTQNKSSMYLHLISRLRELSIVELLTKELDSPLVSTFKHRKKLGWKRKLHHFEMKSTKFFYF